MAGGDRVTVVGGGIGGLVAAIRCAQHGCGVVLYEAADGLGGRARSADGPYKANFGPHALYGDGGFHQWMRREKLLPQLVRPRATGFRVRVDGRLKRAAPELVAGAIKLRGRAPADLDYRSWATQRAGDRAVEGRHRVRLAAHLPSRPRRALGRVLSRALPPADPARHQGQIRGGWLEHDRREARATRR